MVICMVSALRIISNPAQLEFFHILQEICCSSATSVATSLIFSIPETWINLAYPTPERVSISALLERNIQLYISEHLGDVDVVGVRKRAVAGFEVLLAEILVAVVHGLLDLHVVRFAHARDASALFQILC